MNNIRALIIAAAAALLAPLNLHAQGSAAPPTNGLQLWLAATSINSSDVTSQGGSYYVRTWPDQSGNGNNATQNNLSQQPLYVSSGANYEPVVKFNGVNNVMNTPLAQIAGDKSIFVVMKRIDLVRPSGTEISSTLNASGMFMGNMNGAETEGRLSVAHDLGVQGLLGDYILKSYVRASGTGTLTVNGTSTTAVVPDAAGGTYSISDGYYFFFSGAIAEVLIYNRAVTAVEQQTIENYLSEKYGLWTVAVPVLSGLQMWLTPEAINTNNGNQVVNSGGNAYAKTWWDRSVNGLSAVQTHPTTTWNPVVVPNALNARSVVSFNGTCDFMTTNLPQIRGDKSIFMVQQRTSTAVGTELASSSTYNGFFLGDDGLGHETKGRLLIAHDLVLPGLPNQYIIKDFVRTGGTETLMVGGSSASAIVSDTASGDYTLSGGSPNAATVNPFSGNICETLIYNRALSSTEQNLVDAYLQDKWSNPALNLFSVYPDITVPPMVTGAPAPGLRVQETAPTYAGTAVYDALYLPTDWQPGKKYPVIVEYSPNGPYYDSYGDTDTGNVEGDTLGYGYTGGQGYIWISMPTIGGTPLANQPAWWGTMGLTAPSTEDYCLKTIVNVCQKYGGDPSAVILIGFSRGGIACNYVGLYDSTIADTWLAFMPHSGYDGQYTFWGYPYDDDASALTRLQRLQGRLQHISNCAYETSPQAYLQSTGVSMAPFSFRTLPYENHCSVWAERPIQLRRDMRAWLAQVVANKPGTYSISGNVTDTATGLPMAGVQILSGVTHFTTTDVNGNYTLAGLINSTRTVTPSLGGYTFTSQTVTISGGNVQNVNFLASP